RIAAVAGGSKEELGKIVVGGALGGIPQFSDDSAISYNVKPRDTQYFLNNFSKSLIINPPH
ncbi:MAG: hypothetical protein E6549_11170, partial [Streptococcus sp.]|nr:hypothetical protein [Streptococcus sp.]